MMWDHVYLVSKNLKLFTQGDVDELEEKLSINLPDGYLEFMTHLGEGGYCDYIRVYPPKRILNEYRQCQERWNEYYFWDEGRDILTKQQVVESIIWADTIDGDELIFHPSQPNDIYLLPRHSDKIFYLGKSVAEALVWLLKPNAILPIEEDFIFFRSWINRRWFRFVVLEGEPIQFQQVKDNLLKMKLHHHATYEPSDDDDIDELYLYIPTFWGTLTLRGPSGRFKGGISIEADKDKGRDVVEMLITEIQDQYGFELTRSSENTNTD